MAAEMTDEETITSVYGLSDYITIANSIGYALSGLLFLP